MRLFEKIKNKISWVIEDFFWFFFKRVFKAKIKNENLVIGITTFMDRFESCLKPLVEKLAVLFPNIQIIVIANGHVKKEENQGYMINIKSFCDKFKNVELISYEEPMGLSFIWNQILKHANTKKVLMLNDDINIKSSFPKWFSKSDILEKEIATINNSWSHFIISKDIFKKVGPFDEGLLEIGGEDDDYSARLVMNKIELKNLNTNTIAAKLKLKHKRLAVNSFGRNMNEEKHGYSSYNTEYLEKKWKMSNVYFEGAFEVPNRIMRYWKQR